MLQEPDGLPASLPHARVAVCLWRLTTDKPLREVSLRRDGDQALKSEADRARELGGVQSGGKAAGLRGDVEALRELDRQINWRMRARGCIVIVEGGATNAGEGGGATAREEGGGRATTTTAPRRGQKAMPRAAFLPSTMPSPLLCSWPAEAADGRPP
ncbi:hypothetical protein [Oryza sativa Japonica Group]|uniref:Uncharacterized protein n=1 Tax=Oryza sativa subsp. japonica TaxID=39947 RepID=Q5ZAG4_ORYSJ|nr:hypothetical protein [Oryza sativa Japonica Group]BAD53431.1 hypothetical protein [Oryza sativa Japonica Group]